MAGSSTVAWRWSEEGGWDARMRYQWWYDVERLRAEWEELLAEGDESKASNAGEDDGDGEWWFDAREDQVRNNFEPGEALWL